MVWQRHESEVPARPSVPFDGCARIQNDPKRNCHRMENFDWTRKSQALKKTNEMTHFGYARHVLCSKLLIVFYQPSHFRTYDHQQMSIHDVI